MSGVDEPVVFKLEIEGFRTTSRYSIRASEALNKTFEVALELVSERRDLDLESLCIVRPFCRSVRTAPFMARFIELPKGDSGTSDPLPDRSGTASAYLAHRHNQQFFSTRACRKSSPRW